MKALRAGCAGAVLFLGASVAWSQNRPDVDLIATSHREYVNCIRDYVTKLAGTSERPDDIADAGLGSCQRQRGGFVRALFDSRLYSAEQSQAQARDEDVNLRHMALAIILSARHKAASPAP